MHTPDFGTRIVRVPAYLLDLHRCIPGRTEFDCQEALEHNFKASVTGRMPPEDMFGDSRPPNSLRGRAAGQKNGVTLVYCKSVADQTWNKDNYMFDQNWDVHDMCALCTCTKTGPNDFTQFEVTFPRRSTDLYLASIRAISPVTRFPGWHLTGVVAEGMHCGPLGFLCYGNGSGIVELCWEGCFGGISPHGAWQDRLAPAVERAYDAFQVWMQQTHGKQNTQNQWTLSVLDMKRLSSWPLLKVKASHTLEVTDWLAHLTRERGDLLSSYFLGASTFFGILRLNDTFLNDAQLNLMVKSFEAMMFCYRSLGKFCYVRNHHGFPVKPKLHQAKELFDCARATRWNPGRDWTFADEESLRFFKQIIMGTHPSTSSRRALE